MSAAGLFLLIGFSPQYRLFFSFYSFQAWALLGGARAGVSLGLILYKRDNPPSALPCALWVWGSLRLMLSLCECHGAVSWSWPLSSRVCLSSPQLKKPVSRERAQISDALLSGALRILPWEVQPAWPPRVPSPVSSAQLVETTSHRGFPLPVRWLDILSRQQARTVVRFTSFVSFLSGTTVLCCLKFKV